jgi:antitoxin component YwqK of YwqJK toxin-antitoxin module
MDQEDFTNAFIAKLSGLAEMYNEREMKWNMECDKRVRNGTIEFPTNSPTKAIVREYCNGVIEVYSEYENGKMNGKWIWYGYGENGIERCNANYKDGRAHGNAVWRKPDGTVDRIDKWVNGSCDESTKAGA